MYEYEFGREWGRISLFLEPAILHSLIPWSVLRQVHSFFLASSPISNIHSFPSRHPVATYVFFLVFPSLLSSFYISFNGVFYKAVSTQDVTNVVSLLFIVLGYSYPPCLNVILLHYSHERSNISSPSFSSTTFQNFPGTSDVLSEVSKFQHHTKLCIKRSTAVVSSLKTEVQFTGENVFLLNAAFATAILYLTSRVHLSLFVIILPK